ncbi:MAG: BadF/BadG/BcrA/BcrD ATPase family protein [Candidatus Nanopelagicales bacterium]
MTGTREALLAIDGGNSKTDLVLLSLGGELLASARSGPFQPQIVGTASAVASFAPAVARILSTSANPTLLQVSAYLANADLPVETAAIHKAISHRGWTDHVTVENDTFAVLRAGSDRGYGVAVVCGAGINCVGISPSGKHLRFPALGKLTGDWGGGLGLAEEAMWWAVRAEDGRGPATLLSEGIAAHFRTPTAVGVATSLHLGAIDSARLQEVVPLLFASATRGDAISVAIVKRQAEEIVALVSTTMHRLNLESTETDLVLGGGILASNDPVLMQPLTSLLAEAAPSAAVRLLRDPPVVGAALLGLEQLWKARPHLTPTDCAQTLRALREAILQNRIDATYAAAGADHHEEVRQ